MKNKLDINFINEVNKDLGTIVSHYWYVNCKNLMSSSNYLLLPMNHVDLIINMGDEFKYNNITQPSPIHFHGLRQAAITVTNPVQLNALGISFTEWGFYFLINQDMSKFINKIVDLSQVNNSLTQCIKHAIASTISIKEIIDSIEECLKFNVNINQEQLNEISIIKDFINTHLSKRQYCTKAKITTKRLERLFNKYIGISPVQYKKLLKFENTARDLDYQNNNLTEIAYNNDYYDQPHFTKIFRKYTHFTPSEFQKSKPALKSHFK